MPRWEGRWHVVDTRTAAHQSVESHRHPEHAAHAAQVLNDHGERVGIGRVYRTEEHEEGWRHREP